MVAAAVGLNAPARAASLAVPAEFRGGMVFLRVSVGDGRPGVFLLDTGAATTVLDERFAAAARLPLGDHVQLRGGGGRTDARQAENVRLRVAGGGPTLLADPLVADLSGASQGMGVGLDGILGDDVLQRFVLTLDYRAGSARLAASDQVTPPPDAVPMRMISTPFVTATVLDSGHAQSAAFQVDTGSNTAVEFWAPFAQAVFPGAKTTMGAGLGVAGDTRTERGRIDALLVAGRRITNLQANFADLTQPDDAGPAYGGVIGGPAWSGLVLTLDFPHRRLWVR